jgi:hypothetical protein
MTYTKKKYSLVQSNINMVTIIRTIGGFFLTLMLSVLFLSCDKDEAEVLRKTTLEKTIFLADSLLTNEKQEDYSPGAFEPLQDQLDESKAVLTNATTQVELTASVLKLEEAIMAFKSNKLVKTAIAGFIIEAEGLMSSALAADYPPGAITTLQTELSNAKATVDNSSTQSVIDAAAGKLSAAIKVFKDSKLKRTILQERIIQAEELLATAVEGTSIGTYEVGSKAKLQTKIDESEIVLIAGSQLQQTIDDAAQALLVAINEFEESKIQEVSALSFNGNARVDCGPSNPFHTASFTVEAWIYATDGASYIASTEAPGPDAGFSLRLNGGTATGWKLDLTVGLNGGWRGCESDANAILKNTWTHVAGTYDGTDIKIYINGVLKKTTNYPGALILKNSHLYLGDSPSFGPRTFKGKMNRVSFWSVARTQSQIDADRTATIVGTEAGLIAAWPFRKVATGVVPDRTGNHTATLINTTWVAED